MLIALKPFFKRGLNFKVGDRLFLKLHYFEAIKEAKKYNCGHSVGGTKKVEITKPFINFKSKIGKNKLTGWCKSHPITKGDK
jgi:hypothetical protein